MLQIYKIQNTQHFKQFHTSQTLELPTLRFARPTDTWEILANWHEQIRSPPLPTKQKVIGETQVGKNGGGDTGSEQLQGCWLIQA